MNLVILRLFTAPEAEATFEIIVIILLALILGLVLGWFLFRRKSDHSSEFLAEFEAFKSQVNKEQKEQNSLIQSLKDKCGGKVDLSGLEGAIADLKNKQIGFADLAKGIKNYDSEVSGLQSENRKLWDSLNSADKPKDYDSEVSSLQSENKKLWDALNSNGKAKDYDGVVSSLESENKKLWDAINSNGKAKDYDSDVLGLQSENKKLWDAINSNGKSKDYDVEVSGLQSEDQKLWDAIKSGDKPKDYDSEVSGLQSEDQKLWDAINELRKQGVIAKPTAPVASNDKETAKLQNVAAKKHLINFSSIGTATEADRDDLKLIKGVGPFIEKKLNALDIWTFAQVAAFKAEDVDNVTEAIEFFPGRITRDNWVTQAAELAKK